MKKTILSYVFRAAGIAAFPLLGSCIARKHFRASFGNGLYLSVAAIDD